MVLCARKRHWRTQEGVEQFRKNNLEAEWDLCWTADDTISDIACSILAKFAVDNPCCIFSMGILDSLHVRGLPYVV